MACDLWRSKIDAYADNELAADEMRAFSAHLDVCSSCAADALRAVQWKRTVQAAGKRFSPSLELRQRIEEQIAPPKKHAVGAAWLPRFAVAAMLLVALLLAGRAWLSFERKSSLGELADLHVSTLASSSPLDVVSSDRHTVKPWFEGKIPFTFSLPDDLSPFMLLGGRVTYVDQSPGAHLLFQLRQHRVSVFIFQDRFEWSRYFEAGDALSKHLSFSIETWSEGGLRYFVIGDVGAQDIQALSQRIKDAARS